MSGLEDLATMEEGSRHGQSWEPGYHHGLACGGDNAKMFFIDNLLR